MIDLEQEERWAKEIAETRRRLVERVRTGASMSSPTRRRALYQEWRKELGDNCARESAKFVEAIFEGRAKLSDLEKFLDEPRDLNLF